jgi:hypothetical protein
MIALEHKDERGGAEASGARETGPNEAAPQTGTNILTANDHEWAQIGFTFGGRASLVRLQHYLRSQGTWLT